MLGSGWTEVVALAAACAVAVVSAPAGSLIRVKLLPSPRVFDLVVAAVLLPLGFWLALTRPPRMPGAPGAPETDPRSRRVKCPASCCYQQFGDT